MAAGNNIYTKDQVILTVKESTYGTPVLTPTTKHADRVTFNQGVGQITSNRTTGTMEPQEQQVLKGLIAPTGSWTGDLTSTHEVLYKMFFSDSSSPYIWDTDDAKHSYTVFQYDNVQTAYDYISGMRPEKLTISGEVGGLITFSMDMRGHTVDYNVDDDGGTAIVKTSLPDTDTSAPNLAVFQFYDTTCTLGVIPGGVDNLHSFTLELTNVFADDNVNYGNSQTKTQDLVCHGEGTLTYTYLADVTKDDNYYDNLMTSTAQSAPDSIIITDGTVTDTILTYGKYTNFEIDKTGDCMALVTVTKQLMGDGTRNAVSITRA